MRLSPPDSTSTTSSGAWSASSVSTAIRLAVTSSRMAVWGQAPVSTATIRSAVEDAFGAQEPGVLVGIDVVGDHAQLQLSGQRSADGRDQRALARADRSGDPEAERAIQDQALNNLIPLLAWSSANTSRSGAPAPGIRSGSTRSARSAARLLDLRMQSDHPARSLDGVDRQELERGRDDRLRRRRTRPSARSAPPRARSPPRRRRARPAARSRHLRAGGPRTDGHTRVASRRYPRPWRRDAARSTALGVRAAQCSSTRSGSSPDVATGTVRPPRHRRRRAPPCAADPAHSRRPRAAAGRHPPRPARTAGSSPADCV